MARRLAVLIDLSGTLHVEDQGIPGAIEALKKLRAVSQRRQAESNISDSESTTLTSLRDEHYEGWLLMGVSEIPVPQESINVLHNRLTRIGFEIEKNEIFTSLLAARRKIESDKLRPFLMLQDEAKEDFAGLDTTNPNAVVVGLAPSQFHFEKMNEAFRLLLGGATFIAVHKGRYYKRNDGLALGPGPFVRALEYATDKQAFVVGKPEKAFFHSAVESLNASDVLMIGDDVRDDVCGAIDAGFKGILVRTGKYRPSMLCSP
uniref:Haloacid dehalogenase-like hydrolase domain-containing protein 2 n=1 Tax=Steinernema glaseri TaxID=37863 RepID=A0A1I8AG27_9BILA